MFLIDKNAPRRGGRNLRWEAAIAAASHHAQALERAWASWKAAGGQPGDNPWAQAARREAAAVEAAIAAARAARPALPLPETLETAALAAARVLTGAFPGAPRRRLHASRDLPGGPRTRWVGAIYGAGLGESQRRRRRRRKRRA